MPTRDLLEETYGYLRRTIVPELRYSQSVYEDVLFDLLPVGGRWLDIGCGHHLLPPWQFERERELLSRAGVAVGIDVEFGALLKHRSIDACVCSVADRLPFGENVFDAATANMVVEHLDDPVVQFGEINRVLKPGAPFIFHTPNEHGYFAVARRMIPGRVAKGFAAMLDGRKGEDVFGIEYKANSESTIEKVAEMTNFRVERVRFVSSDAVCSILPPVAAIELVWIKMLMRRSMRRFRTNLIVILRKKGNS